MPLITFNNMESGYAFTPEHANEIKRIVNVNSSDGPVLSAMGDSITLFSDVSSMGIFTSSPLMEAVLRLEGRATLGVNAGIGGNTSADMLARIDADLINKAPQSNKCLLTFGTNDTNNGVSYAISETLPNGQAMIDKLIATGIEPILKTIPPKYGLAILPPTITVTPLTTGGTLAAGTYSYRVSALNLLGETLASTAATGTTTGSTGSITISWPSVPGASAYKVYGRTGGSELLMATNVATGGVNRPLCSFIDTGSITPAGALPTANTTASTANDETVAASRRHITMVNNVIDYLARKNGLQKIDTYPLYVDGATGKFKVGCNSDDTHPSVYGQRLEGAKIALEINNKFPQCTPYLAGDNLDPTCISANPLFNLNNGTRPTGWYFYNGSGGTESITDSADVLGKVFTINHSGANDNYFVYGPNITTGWSVGDLISFSGKVKFTGANTGGGFGSLRLMCVGTAIYILNLNFYNDTDGFVVFSRDLAIPSGTTGLQLQSRVAKGVCTLEFGQLTIRNLTTLGLA